MGLYKGSIVINILTAVENNEDERVMRNDAHENITNDLLNELMALVGAKGYLVGSISADLKNNGEANNRHIGLIEESTKEAKIKTDHIYNKANTITSSFKL
ncbi:hypothetical protein ACQKND_09245 [Viridibacillus arvi]|uniref:hypothetical protein n=1 Tax=Viridibacillus arvi TaxID=263475 RepID=UPI003D070B0D